MKKQPIKIEAIRISKRFSLQYKNGYFETREYSKKGDSAKVPGEEYMSAMKTYPDLLTAYEVLTALGEDGNAAMIAGDKLLNLYGVVGRAETKSRQIK